MLQELFNLTDAEAHLAQALCTGKTTMLMPKNAVPP
jgi:hypothetical protein